MRVGLLITSVGNFGQKGFYNAQEIGLAKELDKLFDEVIIYKAISENQIKQVTKIEGCKNVTLYQVPVQCKGTNGMWKCEIMDTTLEALIFFSDTQVVVPKVYKWCKKNNVILFPYIGVAESHSTNKIKKIVINTLFRKNIRIYKKCSCFVKTPVVEKKLNSMGIKKTTVIPVGLDISILNEEYNETSSMELKRKYGYSKDDRVILFIGRLIEEKQPIQMIKILSEVRKKDDRFKLLIVGKGELKQVVLNKINELCLIEDVQMITQIPNNDIWELYHFADSFVNLNKQEIFGMAILEAMYYGCKVIAWNAPGPNLIIEDGKSGWLTKSSKEVIDKILDSRNIGNEAHKRVLNKFTWESSAKKIFSVIGE